MDIIKIQIEKQLHMQDPFNGYFYFMISPQAFCLWQCLPMVVESEVPGGCTICHGFFPNYLTHNNSTNGISK